jgi:hypothetical protein
MMMYNIKHVLAFIMMYQPLEIMHIESFFFLCCYSHYRLVVQMRYTLRVILRVLCCLLRIVGDCLHFSIFNTLLFLRGYSNPERDDRMIMYMGWGTYETAMEQLEREEREHEECEGFVFIVGITGIVIFPLCFVYVWECYSVRGCIF